MISEAYVTFFEGLEKNNNKEWFHQHKTEYEKEVKVPFLTLLDQLIPQIRKMQPLVSTNPKDALFRINRDIRFAKDKSPYHTLLKAGFSAEGKKSQLPGFYLGISSTHVHIGGGLFMLDTNGIKAVRALIAANTDEFIAIVEEDSFKKTFGELKGDRAKRLDKALIAVQEKTAYIANKQFYAMTDIPLKKYLNSDRLQQLILDHFRMIHPLNEFLNQAQLK